MDQVEAVVVGAGAVGLAVARALALAGREVIVLEAAEAIGTGTSSRNSEVIHAGIYYPAGSLKARLCVAGKPALYAYCRDRGVAAPNLGKLIVAATPEQIPELVALSAKAAANGVADLRLIEAAEARALEPNLVCAAALVSPSTGIVDSHGFMLALEGDLEAAGGVVALHTPVERLIATRDGIVVQAGGAAPCELLAGLVVNSAGLGACALGRATQGLDPARVPQDFLCKGHYFSLVGVKAPFARLVYPLPEQAGLGIHATVDLGGQVRFGPDVLWTDTLDYSPASGDAARFYAAIRSYWPGLPDGALQPTYTGIRPKIVGPGAPAADFVIDGPADHGIAVLVNLFGIESPGLTASLAIADHVAALVSARQPRRAIA